MRTRNKGYDDYGFAAGEAERLKAFCRQADFSEYALLLECSKKSNSAMGSDLYYSIVKGLSFERMDRKVYQACTKGDFYGYQRKALALFRDALIEGGRYPIHNSE